MTVSRNQARERLGLGQNERVLVYVGQIHPYKGIDHLLAASAALPADVDLRIMVIGRCPNEAKRTIGTACRTGWRPCHNQVRVRAGRRAAVLPSRR